MSKRPHFPSTRSRKKQCTSVPSATRDDEDETKEEEHLQEHKSDTSSVDFLQHQVTGERTIYEEVREQMNIAYNALLDQTTTFLKEELTKINSTMQDAVEQMAHRTLVAQPSTQAPTPNPAERRPVAPPPTDTRRDLRAAAADSIHKIRKGTTTLDTIKAQLQDHPHAIIGGMLLGKETCGNEYWIQIADYSPETRTYLLQEATDNQHQLAVTLEDIATAAMVDGQYLTQVAAQTRHLVPLPDKMVGTNTRYDHQDMCVYQEMITLHDHQVQHSFRLVLDTRHSGEDDTDRPKGNRKTTFGEAAWSHIGAARSTVKNYRGKDLPFNMQLPRFAEGDGAYTEGRGGAGRNTAMTQDVGDRIATTLGINDIMQVRTVTEQEATEAANTKTAPELQEDPTWDTGKAIDAYRNWVDAADMVVQFKEPLKSKLCAIGHDMGEFMRSRESSDPGLNKRQFPRRYFNAMIRGFSNLMSNPATKEHDLAKLIDTDMVVTTKSPFYEMAAAGMRAQLEDQVTQALALAKQHGQSSKPSPKSSSNSYPTAKATDKPKSKPPRGRDKPTHSGQSSSSGGNGSNRGGGGSGGGGKTPCFMTFTQSGCTKNDCSFDHTSGRALTEHEKGRLRRFVKERNKGKADDDLLEIRPEAL